MTEIGDLLNLIKGLRADINDHYIAHKKAGDMIVLLDKINTNIDNYDRAKRRSNRRI